MQRLIIAGAINNRLHMQYGTFKEQTKLWDCFQNCISFSANKHFMGMSYKQSNVFSNSFHLLSAGV